MSPEWPAAGGEAGKAGLRELPDGSLVDPARYDDRYGRGAALPEERQKDSRTETERDRGRLAYSPSLRRLAGVTQIVSPDLSAARMHTRGSHTHKVALVARELAELVIRRAKTDGSVAKIIFDAGGLDIAACESAGLAHDLGHAPFGHAGEVELHRLLRKKTVDGFEGNPQSFRIVTRLDGATNSRTNMDLTNVTLCAILKYPRKNPLRNIPAEAPGAVLPGSGETSATGNNAESEKSAAEGADTSSLQADPPEPQKRNIKPPKYGAYAEDWEQFAIVRQKIIGDGWETDGRQSLEASIMDLADDIAYAIHDLEDFCASGMIDLHDVKLKIVDAIGSIKGSGSETPFAEVKPPLDPFTAATGKLRDLPGLFFDRDYEHALGSVEKLVDQIFQRSADGEMLTVVLRDALSERLGIYFDNVEISVLNDEAPLVRLSRTSWHEMQVLKVIPRQWLIQSPRMGVIQLAQTQTIKTLFKTIEKWLEHPGTEPNSLPEGLRAALTIAGVDIEHLGELDSRHYRAIGDYITGLSDNEALLRANWFSGREIPGMTMIAEAY